MNQMTRRGFGLHAELMPSLHVDAVCEAQGFAALADPRMGLYAIVDSAAWVERVLAAGVRTVQLRIKEGAPDHLAREVLREIEPLVVAAAGSRSSTARTACISARKTCSRPTWMHCATQACASG